MGSNVNKTLLVMYVDAKYANEETVAGGFLVLSSHPSQCSVYIPPHPPTVTEPQLQLLIGSLLGHKSTPPQASYQKLLPQEGRMELSGMTCGKEGRGGA